jgi:hypothetical protein
LSGGASIARRSGAGSIPTELHRVSPEMTNLLVCRSLSGAGLPTPPSGQPEVSPSGRSAEFRTPIIYINYTMIIGDRRK